MAGTSVCCHSSARISELTVSKSIIRTSWRPRRRPSLVFAANCRIIFRSGGTDLRCSKPIWASSSVRAEELRLSPVQLPNLLKPVIAARRALRIFAATGLAKNSGAMLEAHRRQFAERDRSKIENDRVYIRKGLLQKKPEPGSSSGRENYGPKWRCYRTNQIPAFCDSGRGHPLCR